jgi:hypothetical protein
VSDFTAAVPRLRRLGEALFGHFAHAAQRRS